MALYLMKFSTYGAGEVKIEKQAVMKETEKCYILYDERISKSKLYKVVQLGANYRMYTDTPDAGLFLKSVKNFIGGQFMKLQKEMAEKAKEMELTDTCKNVKYVDIEKE